MEDILKALQDTIRLAEKTLTFERIFDRSGITDLLEEMYITPTLLSKEYRNIIFNAVKDFVKQPLYKDLNINVDEDLIFLNRTDLFKTAIEKTFQKIKDSLAPRTTKLLKYFEGFEKSSEIALSDIVSSLKFDKTSLLFMLDDLKKRHKIYDFNGRYVTLN